MFWSFITLCAFGSLLWLCDKRQNADDSRA